MTKPRSLKVGLVAQVHTSMGQRGGSALNHDGGLWKQDWGKLGITAEPDAD
jgi:hypothetical protein